MSSSDIPSFVDIIKFWFPNNQYQEFWFDGTKDYEIESLFSGTLKIAEKGELDFWNTDKYGILAHIILLDQFTRNMYRTSNFRKNDARAFELAKSIVDADGDLIYPFNMRMFILLPYRHQRKTEYLDFVMTRLNGYDTEYFTDTELSLLEKFKLATLKDYSKVTDTIIVHSKDLDVSHPIYDPHILDDMCGSFVCVPPKEQIDITLPLYKSILKYIQTHNIKIVGVSLSGGVDSMVMAYLLYQMRLKKLIDDIVCVHVNYGNRDVSDVECEYIINWCKYLNIRCITRRIEHMKRKDGIDREFYEEETRKIRFGLYKYTNDHFGTFGFCLGHHKDDLSENVFMNIMRGKDIFDLFVMRPLIATDGINLLRPMIDHHKSDIYEASNMYGICYMKDTTPLSSFRGTIRKQIFPAIDSFDPGMQANLILAGKRSDEWNLIIELLTIKPYLDSLIKGKCGFSISIIYDMFSLPPTYWSRLLMRVFHTCGIRMATQKNICHMVKWFKTQVIPKKSSIYRLSNGCTCTVKDDKMYFMMHQLEPDTISSNVAFDLSDDEKTINFDKWLITFCKVSENDYKCVTYDDVITGEYSYVCKVNEKITFAYLLSKNDITKKKFRGLGNYVKYLPKLTTDDPLSGINFVKATFKFVSSQ